MFHTSRAVRPGATLVVLVSLLLASAPAVRARAQDTQTTASARALFDEGMALAERDAWETAADRLRRSHALRPSPVVAYNLARADVRIGRLVEASELLRTIRHDARATQGLRDAANARLAEVAPRLARLRIVVRGDRRDVAVALDGRRVVAAAIGVHQPTDPGDRLVTATRGDAEIVRRRVTLAPGGSDSVTLVLPRSRATTQDREAFGAVPGPEPAGVRSGTALPWILLGTGLAMTVAATLIVFALVASGQESRPVPGNLQPGIIELGR